MSHLQPVPLSMTDNSIDPHRFYEEVKKLSQRLNNDNAHARLRKWGTLDLKVFVGDGTSHPNDVFIQSYLSIIRWAGTFSTVELPQSNRLGIVSRKKIDQIVEWNKKSLRNILYFIEKYPGEKMALVTWVDKQEAGGFATPSMFRLKCDFPTTGEAVGVTSEVAVKEDTPVIQHETQVSNPVAKKIIEHEHGNSEIPIPLAKRSMTSTTATVAEAAKYTSDGAKSNLKENSDGGWENLESDLDEGLDMADWTVIEKHTSHPTRPHLSFH